MNIYAPNKDEPVFFQIVMEKIMRFTPDYYVISGDLNLALDVKLDCKGTIARFYPYRLHA